jgi:hypothetical protein
MRLLFIVLTTAYLFQIFNVVNAKEPIFDHNLFGKFQNEAPISWKQYIRNLSKSNVILISKNLQNGEVVGEVKSNYYLLYPCNVKEYSADGKDIVRCAGTNYSFLLEKNVDSRDWQLTDIMFFDDNKPTLFDWENSLDGELTDSNLLKRNFRYVQNEIAQGILIWGGTYLPSIVKLPEFKIKNIYLESIGGIDKVHIDYEFEPVPEKYETFSVRSGTLILHQKSWLIESGKFDLELSGVRLHYTVQYVYEYNDFEMPTLIKRVLSNSYKNIDYSSIFELNIKPDDPILPSRFTLSHYGLPEPDFDNSRRTNRVRYILMGLGAILIGIALWRMIQKRRGKM